MRLRFAAVAALTAFVLVLPAQVGPPPMFSPWYGDALRDILKLEDPEAARLERKLASNPDDFSARLKLMAYEARADRATHPEERAKRFHHALWLIEHHPESELLHSYVSLFSRGELAAADFQRAVALWEAAAKAWPREAAVQWNAASFFQGLDAEFHLRYLEATAAADPNHPFAIRPLAEIYALSILNGGPRGLRAQAALAASHNLWVISNAAYMLQSQYNLTVQRGVPDQRVAELAERYFLRAKAIDPKLDRQKILPSLDPQVSARARQVERQAQQDWEAHAKEAVGKIRRLPVEAFPELPATVAGVLRARHCRVPQPSPGNPPRNVIRGEFFAKGVSGWAVLCSVNNRTTLLAFRNEHDTNPDSVATGEDQTYVQDLGGGQIGYLHEITAVGRDFIMGHFRAYGGPEPPAIDHLGIDDSFHEKASVTWYQHNGKWLKLTGAD